MKKQPFKIVLIFLFITALLFSFYLFKRQPNLDYEIRKYNVEEKEEQELVLTLHEMETKIDFNVSFLAEDGSNEEAYLKSRLIRVNWFPFVWFDNNIEINFLPGKIIDDETFVIYEVTGSITNFTSSEGRVSVIDSFENLIDEKYFVYEKSVVSEDLEMDSFDK